jgi:molybdate transport system regulatory protein
MKLSARNVLSGTVASVRKGAVNTEVILDLKGGSALVSVITNTSADNLALKQGTAAFAIVKASSIIVGTDLEKAKSAHAIS